MSVAECNFSFNGRHCLRDFGCFYIMEKNRPLSPETAFQTFEVSGNSGNLIYGDQRTFRTMEHKGMLYPMVTPASYADGMRLYRQISAWLRAGRRRLIWDFEPDRYLLAEVEDGIEYTESRWPDGGLTLTMRCQPYAYDVREASASATITTGQSSVIELPLYTGEPAPVCVDIVNTGTAAITSASVAVGPKCVMLAGGLALANGQKLKIDMEPPIGASIGDDSALPYATRFDYLEAGRSANVTVTLTFAASGTKSATARAHARGRWI
ncbi:MAG: hypothetical protein RSE23_01835 [Clostridia bacterium]